MNLLGFCFIRGIDRYAHLSSVCVDRRTQTGDLFGLPLSGLSFFVHICIWQFDIAPFDIWHKTLYQEKARVAMIQASSACYHYG